jgi:predicted NUDIX family phosphoesterase
MEEENVLSEEKYNEVVRFVLREEAEKKLGKPTGFIEANGTDNNENLEIEIHFAKRGELEEDESKLQIIPYVVFRVWDGDKLNGILMYVRKGSESRLLNKLSIGFGGHSGTDDGNIRETACREVEEEIGYSVEPKDLNFVGYIFSNNDAVSRVHIGYVYLSDMKKDSFEVLNISDEIKELCLYMPNGQVCEGKVENWSSIILNNESLMRKIMR